MNSIKNRCKVLSVGGHKKYASEKHRSEAWGAEQDTEGFCLFAKNWILFCGALGWILLFFALEADALSVLLIELLLLAFLELFQVFKDQL